MKTLHVELGARNDGMSFHTSDFNMLPGFCTYAWEEKYEGCDLFK